MGPALPFTLLLQAFKANVKPAFVVRAGRTIDTDARRKAMKAKQEADRKKAQARPVTAPATRPRRRGARGSSRTFSPGRRISPPVAPRFRSRHTYATRAFQPCRLTPPFDSTPTSSKLRTAKHPQAAKDKAKKLADQAKAAAVKAKEAKKAEEARKAAARKANQAKYNAMNKTVGGSSKLIKKSAPPSIKDPFAGRPKKEGGGGLFGLFGKKK